MLAFVLSLRFVLLLASLGASGGALLMFFEGGGKLVSAVRVVSDPNGDKAVIALVMGATDALLFGVVLVVFAYAITFGFVLRLDERERRRVPAWMQVDGISALKRRFFEVILVYLTVDFATDIASGEDHLAWPTLVVPASILMLAGALRLLTAGHAEGPPHGNAPEPP